MSDSTQYDAVFAAVLTRARLEAQLLNHAHVHGAHLLVALVTLRKNTPELSTAYDRMLVHELSARRSMANSFRPYKGEEEPDYDLSEGAAKVIDRAVEIAKEEGVVAGPTHLLLALTEIWGPDVSRIFAQGPARHPEQVRSYVLEAVEQTQS